MKKSLLLGLILILSACTDHRNPVELTLFDQCKKINKMNCEAVYEKTVDAFYTDSPSTSLVNSSSNPFGSIRTVFTIEDEAFKQKYPTKKPISVIYFESTGKQLFENSVEQDNSERINVGMKFYDDIKVAIKLCGNEKYLDSISIGDKISVDSYKKLEKFAIDCKENSIKKSMGE